MNSSKRNAFVNNNSPSRVGRRRSPRHSPSPSSSSSSSPSPNPRGPPRDLRCVRVSNLNRNTIAATVRDVFTRWGIVERVELNLDGNEMPDGSALVLFKSRPMSLDFLRQDVRIDGNHVRMELVNELNNPDRLFRDHQQGRRTRVPARHVAFGVMSSPRTFVEEWSTEDDIAMTINYDRRQIHIFFNRFKEKFKLEFSFKDMTNGELLMERDNHTLYFTIQLKFPARFWVQNRNAVQETKTSVVVGGQWERITELPMTSDPPRPQPPGRTPIMPHVEAGKSRLGMWTTYRIKFVKRTRDDTIFEEMLSEAAEYNLVPRDTSNMPVVLSVKNSSSLPPFRSQRERAAELPFDVLYMLESLILSYQFNEYNLDDDFYHTIKQLEPSITTGIFDILYATKKRAWAPMQAITQTYNEMGVKVSHRRHIPDHCAMIRKIIVTPTTMDLQPPSIETTNRVVRHYREYADRFVRVQFVDEGMQRISASYSRTGNDAIYNRIFKVLRNGIQVGARRYEFLAFSSSQLRDHGGWFFAPTKDLGVNEIRQWMGSFRKEKIVAKHAVRMGQCFSSTRRITELNHDEVEYIDDVVRNGYTFSDGVGIISRALAEEVAMAMDLKEVPSAFQFRFGGAKGVLSKSPTTNKERKIQLRPSQIKFDSNHYELEVIRVSTRIPGYLNRQAITILSTLGVPDKVFMDKMHAMISNMDMDRMLEKPTEAIRTLLSNIDEFGTTRSMARIIQAGFLEKRDPYIVNLLKMFRVSMLKDLKKKAKILVNKGAFLLGIMDETGTLKEGEVFCKISGASSKGRHKIIQGEVVVFRNPCFHPGDIRVVQAVDNPRLHHLVDVLVFSSQGFRDIPSICSGGDLDGDDYTIFWDEDLIPKIKNYPAMDYTAEEPLRVDDVSIKHICSFFVNYINNDNLGMIANAHLATADRSSKGALDGACLRLAQLHSLAVDFPKSGKPAKFSDDLRVRVFPDFMQKKDKESYESQKVLGKIYREIDKSDYKEYQSQLVDNTIYDVRLRVDNMECYIQEARELKAEYGRDLLALMNQYGVQTEAEIVSGYIIKWLKKNNRKSMHEIQKQTMAAVTNMRKLWRERFERNLENELGARHAKAAAWYYVTYHPEERLRDVSEEGKFLSFPWVVDDVLCEIAKMNNNVVSEEDRAKPVDDALVKRFGDARKPMQYTMYYSSDEDSEGEEDLDELKSSEHDESESQDENADDEEEVTPAIKSFVLSSQPPPKQPTKNISPKITIVKNENHFNVSASDGDEALANALL